MSEDDLDLDNLAQRHPGVTKAVADCYFEAASVCLSRHHTPPSKITVEYSGSESVRKVDWTIPGEPVKRAWANHLDTTEAGAYGVSLAAVETEKGLVAVMRAETQTGADYYIAPAGSSLDALEEGFRLEVSGVDSGNLSAIKRRLDIKVKQAKAGKSNLPAMAAVVGFKESVVYIADVKLP